MKLLTLPSPSVRPPKIAELVFPNLIWRMPTKNNSVYLTFDDGPIPEITEWVLKTLDNYNIKATFFCVGDNVRKHPSIFQMVKDQDHVIGQHTHNHLSGWSNMSDSYLSNIKIAEQYIDTNLFRPPYGKMRFSLARAICERYKIIMWDVLSRDFDQEITPDDCFQNVKQHTSNGSIIVFHDSIKAFKNMQYALPKSIEYLGEKGFTFDTIRF